MIYYPTAYPFVFILTCLPTTVCLSITSPQGTSTNQPAIMLARQHHTTTPLHHSTPPHHTTTPYLTILHHCDTSEYQALLLYLHIAISIHYTLLTPSVLRRIFFCIYSAYYLLIFHSFRIQLVQILVINLQSLPRPFLMSTKSSKHPKTRGRKCVPVLKGLKMLQVFLGARFPNNRCLTGVSFPPQPHSSGNAAWTTRKGSTPASTTHSMTFALISPLVSSLTIWVQFSGLSFSLVLLVNVHL